MTVLWWLGLPHQLLLRLVLSAAQHQQILSSLFEAFALFFPLDHFDFQIGFLPFKLTVLQLQLFDQLRLLGDFVGDAGALRIELPQRVVLLPLQNFVVLAQSRTLFLQRLVLGTRVLKLALETIEQKLVAVLCWLEGFLEVA